MNRIDTVPELPKHALAALDALEAAGFEAWVVGGCVRDTLLGRPVHDYDIASAAHWADAETALLNAGFDVHRTGTAHGTVTASIDGQAIEITTYRTDGAYSDGRHPDEVEFVANIAEDLARRDFTMNAIAYHPERGFLDLWHGLDDIKTGTIRAVGDPRTRFKEDALRILRGCRFASQLGFRIDPETLRAMNATKTGLARISSERITHELDELLMGSHVHNALMETANVLAAVLPEIAACIGFDQHTPYHVYDVWEHTSWVVQHAPAVRLVRWAALFHDIGKPAAFFMEGDRAHFYGHPKLSALLAEDAMRRLTLSPKFVEQVLVLVRMHDEQIAATPRSVKRVLAKLDGDVDLFRALINLKRADALAQSSLSEPRLELAGELESVLEEILEADEAFTLKQLDISGRDIMTLGMAEGPEVGRILEACLEAVIDERIANNRESLLAYARQEGARMTDAGPIRTEQARSKSGFTLMEVLIVIAIIGVLISLAVVVIFDQVERGREAVDLSSVRSAYTEVMVQWASSNGNPDSDISITVPHLQQQVDGWTTDVSGISIGNIPSSEWVGEPRAGGSCTVLLSPVTGKIVINWGLQSYVDMSLMELAQIDNDERVLADQETIRSLGQAILDQGWTEQQLKDYLGLPETSGGAVRIADYYQLKTGDFASEYESAGFKITSKTGGKLDDILTAIGYDGGTVLSTEVSNQRTYTTYQNSLFFSNELTTNNYGGYGIDATKRSIIIQDLKKDAGGHITGFTIYTKAMDHQADMSDADKAKFRIKLP